MNRIMVSTMAMAMRRAFIYTPLMALVRRRMQNEPVQTDIYRYNQASK